MYNDFGSKTICDPVIVVIIPKKAGLSVLSSFSKDEKGE